MDNPILTLDKGTRCTAWNYSGQRLAAGLADGALAIYDSTDPASSTFSCTSRFKVQESSILRIVWVPPEYGDVVACVTADGTLSLWEEVVEDTEGPQWRLCKCFDRNTSQILDVQFGNNGTCLKLVAAYSDGQVKIYELLDTLELGKWQLQAEFQNVIDLVSKYSNASCLSASISWNPQRSEVQQSNFVLGFNSNIPPLNSAKVWEFDLDHQRWLPVAELSSPEDKNDQVYAVAWAPNIGRPYELIAVATDKEISIWHLGSNPDPDGRLSVQKVAMLSGHGSEVWQMEWDISGMTLASTGSDGVVRLWQSNLNGVWHEQAVLAPAS
ncbi:hypothetical protein RD792_009028 [Penstemon davidsonii]|uniref:Protein SEH1 n=1 Tax=Penstemon davidsonii TaxID=160366 RepID=A0ABR0DBZ2_9LAMI|nr:hypothetical protein RD792_009028 [Penstemon davidsonii]